MIPIFENPYEKIAEIHAQNQSQQSDQKLEILEDMRRQILSRGDEAVLDYTRKFDRVSDPDFQLKVTQDEINEAFSLVPAEFVEAVEKASDNIRGYHLRQKPESWQTTEQNGVIRGMKYSAIPRVGLYVPGGRAPYPSTVMMDSIPALIAGVESLSMVTPPQANGKIAPQILVAAAICGLKHIFKVGGAQAIFALAYGTQTIQPVDKIVGPGNIYVTLAKQMVYGKVDIDKPAGPSEALVYVEDPSLKAIAASELLAQLEHDPLTSAIGISTDRALLEAIQSEMKLQVQHCSRKDIIEQAVNNSALFLVSNRAEAVTMINAAASEHSVLLIEDYQEMLSQIQHAGAIFCGVNTPVALGDYFGGPNHVLPTSGAARFSSPLSVMDFLKFSSVMAYTKEALYQAAPHIQALSEMEGFDAHYASIRSRLS